MKKNYDVVAIGNAIVDVLAFADEKFVTDNGVQKGTMMLIDQERAQSLYEKMGSGTEVSGGSAANTLAGMASLGAKTAFIGKVFNDELGRIFRHDMRAVGVDFDTESANQGRSTARCLILVTPDGQRTMNTFIGACNELYEGDIDEKLIAEASIVYGEGYMWDMECTKAALVKSFKLAKQHGAKVAFTLSDVFCVSRSRDEFMQLIEEYFDILFCNEAELDALFPGLSFEEQLSAIEGKCEIIAVTRGEKGSVVLSGGARHIIAPHAVSKVVDTTGAGDLYAAGFLYGLTHSKPLPECGALGSACAAQIIQHIGARVQQPLKQLVA